MRLLPGETSTRTRRRVDEACEPPPSPSVAAIARRFESKPTMSSSGTTTTTVAPRRRLSRSRTKTKQVENRRGNGASDNNTRNGTHQSQAQQTQRRRTGVTNKTKKATVVNASSTTTPAQKELAQYLNARMTSSTRSSAKSEKETKNFDSLVQRWQGGGSNGRRSSNTSSIRSREPFQPKIDQQHDSGSIQKDSTPDTFCDFPVDLIRPQGPQTDPGQLESYAKLYIHGDGRSNAQVMSDQTIADMVKNSPLRPAAQRAAEAAALIAGEKDDDHMQELFKEAEETAEKAVMCDENEEYYEAFELYYVVVQLYWKVIPFMSPSEGDDIRSRIKMYIKRCDAIQEAFEDEGAEVSDIDEEDDEKFETPQLEYKPNLVQEHHMNDLQQNYPAAASVQDRQPQVNRSQSSIGTARKTPVEYAQPKNDRQGDNPSSESRRKKPPRAEAAGQANGTVESTVKPTEVPLNLSNKLPDARVDPIQGTAPRQLHDSLSRPISRRAVRASTSSVSREKVAEMQERVQVMQDCLNNFTVKRKHLGPARALELQVTTLNANTFGDLKRLGPLPPKLEHRWVTELGVLLSVLQEIKEPRTAGSRKRKGGGSSGGGNDGKNLRHDIRKHLPNLESCDRRVQRTVRTFAALEGKVEYVDRETAGSKGHSKGRSRRRWWVKVPKVAPGGLEPDVRKVVDEAEKEMKGVFKVCHEINVEIVKSMPVPGSFVAALPRHTKNLIGRELKEGLTTWDMFKITDFMKDRKMWNRESAKETASALEKVALLWESKTNNMNWVSRTLDFRGERVQQMVTAYRRCQTALKDLRREWPTMTHTALDMAKIESNSDVGRAGLEAYSRALESRAARLLSRIRELIDADNEARKK